MGSNDSTSHAGLSDLMRRENCPKLEPTSKQCVKEILEIEFLCSIEGTTLNRKKLMKSLGLRRREKNLRAFR